MIAVALVTRPERTSRDYAPGDGKGASDRAAVWSRLLLPMFATAVLFSNITEIRSETVSRITATLVVCGLLATELLRYRHERGHRALVDAAPWRGDTGVRALVDGTVRDPTPVVVGHQSAAVGRVTAYDKGIGSNPDTVKWARFHSEGTFLVDTRAGVVEVSPAELAWASTVVDAPTGATFDYEVSELVPVGGKVAAVGWIEAGADGAPPRLRSRGTEPADLLATSAIGDPRGLAWRMVWHRRLNLLALPALGAALAAVAP
jgi:hypothetical protein